MTSPAGNGPAEIYPEIARLLSSEQLERCQNLSATMTASLDILQHDIQIISVEHDIFAVDASPNGQYIGRYNVILDKRIQNPDWYTFMFEGQRIDPLAGMVENVYREMIEDAKRRNVQFLPDSVALSQQNDEVWTATMMTGEGLTEDGLIPIMSVTSGKADKVDFRPDRGGRSQRVRPTVLVATL